MKIDETIIKLLETIGFIGAEVSNLHNKKYESIRPTEKKIDVMNDFEKSCSSFIAEKEKEQYLVSLAIKAKSFNKELKEDKYLQKEYDLLSSVIEVINGLMWISIKSRVEIPQGAEVLVLRKGFLIVASYKKERASNPCFCVLLSED